MKSLICAPKRTAIGSFQASLAGFSAPQLGATALRASLAASGLAPDRIDEVYMGCVLTAGVGQAPARQAALGAGLPQKTPCTTIGKVCGSGLKSVMLADLAIRTGEAEAVLAGGMESMSNSLYLIPKLRSGLRMGHGELVDSMIKDGLWDVYNDFHMGKAAELCASEFRLTREAQDEFARESYRRALASIEQGLFKDEIIAVEVGGRKPFTFAADEEPGRSDAAKFAQLRPVFDPQGTVTAANASTLNDGAAAVLVCSEELARRENLQPFARIVAQAQTAQAPEKFTTAPAASLDLALRKAGLQRSDIALWEINEAFAVVALANLKLLEIDPARVNVRGGAVALGHPIGASGTRILVTLCHALAQTRQRYGAASLCIGGGEATSVIVENLRV